MLVNGTIVLDDEDQSSVLMDFAIHDCHVDGKNVLQRYLEKNPPAAGSELETLLTAIRQGYYSIFQVESVVAGAGVWVNDLWRREQRFLADRGFGATASRGAVVGTRVYNFPDFLMTGGAALPIDATILRRVLESLTLPENRNLAAMSRERRAALNAKIIRLGMDEGNRDKVRYADVDEIQGPKQTQQSQRPGRNDPCPCGSGKKYKKCCIQ
jgi:hypothetical protein